MRRSVRLAALILPLLTALPASAELAATFEAGGAKDVRLDRLPALLIQAGESPSAFVAPGAFTATWSGKLSIAKRMKYQFSFEGEGTASMTIDGKEVLKEDGAFGTAKSPADRLAAGDHEVTIVYKSKADGSGKFRLYWEEASFPRQTVPATLFTTETKADVAHAGRFLLAENNCAKCHMSTSGIMPEILETRPLLFSSGSRLNEKWIAQWIADPTSLKPDTRMPKLVDASTPEGKQQAADIAAYLMSLKAGDAPAAPDKSLAAKGGQTFHRLGCVACHTSPDKGELDTEHNRIPLSNVADKFQPGALVTFLKNPEALYPSIGMPNFRLTDEEASGLAAFLLENSAKVEKKHPDFPKGDATRGATLANTLNCGICHAGTGIPTPAPGMEAIIKKDWAAAGCVVNKTPGKLPKMQLTEDEKLALIAFSKKGNEPLARNVPVESAAHKFTALRCTACHMLDGKASLLDTVQVETKALVAGVTGENEKLDQTRPQLTYMGEMLHSSYIESMLSGTVKERPRHWLDTRMPGFPGHAAELAKGIALTHGVAPGKPADFTPDQALVDTGKQLIGNSGFNCTSCHGVGSLKPTAVFEAEGINLALAHERLRHEYFVRWMDNPPAITPSTKMPVFGDGHGKTQQPAFDGEAAKQFEAIWNYIQTQKPE